MESYEQYCPIARATEVLGERWTFIIIRNLFLGCDTFTQIADGAPGLPRSTLTQRLRHLERNGLVERIATEKGRSARYKLTSAGRDLWDVCIALGNWGARWLDVAPEHCDPYTALWSMSRSLVRDLLPPDRVVVRFNFRGFAKRTMPIWLIIDDGEGEICLRYPGFEADLVVDADAESFVKWHMGRVSWADAVEAGHISVAGPPGMARALPTWNKLSTFAGIQLEPSRA